MKRSILGILILLFISKNSYCQLKTYLVVEAGTSWDILRISDSTNKFENAYLFGSAFGMAFWQEILEDFSLGTGVYYHPYLYGINPIDQRPHQASTQNLSALLIPIRVSYRLKLNDYPLSITPTLGYQHGIITGFTAPNNWNSSIGTPESDYMNYSLTDWQLISNRLHLIEAGITVDYRFKNNWQLSLAISQLSGLRDVSTSLLSYVISIEDHQISVDQDGSRIQSDISLHIPLSNLWENKKLRLHRKIENSSSRGSSTKNFRYIYFGGDFGALWRSFSTTNPAIGPIPRSGKGIFRYSNLNSGIYFGYMFNRNTGLDIGAYFQRSSNHFSLMYDHEVDYANKIKAPFFLEMPIMFRYYFNIYDEKLFLAPSIGISAMTHFSGVGDEYNRGNGTFNYGEFAESFNYSASRVSRFAYSVKAGMGLEYKIPIKLALHATINITYSQGLAPVDLLLINTSISETPFNNQIVYEGSGWKALIGLRIPIIIGKDNRKCGAIPIKR